MQLSVPSVPSVSVMRRRLLMSVVSHDLPDDIIEAGAPVRMNREIGERRLSEQIGRPREERD